MRFTCFLTIIAVAGILRAQDGQQGPASSWPCVPGRAVDPSYLSTSESTGGQLFLFQKGEVAQSGPVMSASYTHPATIVRLVGHLTGTRDVEFPVDGSVESLLVLASLQCRSEIRVLRPSGSEATSMNSAQSVELAAGKILRVDQPEAGAWRVHLAGRGLFVLSVLAKSEIRLTGVSFSLRGDGDETGARLSNPMLGTPQLVDMRVSGQVSHVGARLMDAAGGAVAGLAAPEKTGDGAYRSSAAVQVERFRVVVTGEDGSAMPFQRMYPVLFTARRTQ